MRKINSKILLVSACAGIALFASSCTPDLLNQRSTSQLYADQFWKQQSDAEYALNGAYYSARGCFDRDYHFDKMGEFVRSRSGTHSATADNVRLGDAYRNITGDQPNGSPNNGWTNMFKYLYGVVYHTNYVIGNTEKMMAENPSFSKLELEAVIGEAKLLRALAYFRLITMWGDVPYYSHIVKSNAEVESLPRTSLVVIKDSILADLTYAIAKLPEKRPSIGRVGKAAAIALRGKVYLYYACWTRPSWPWSDPKDVTIGFPINGTPGGWPEANLKPDAAASKAAYAAAAADFKTLIDNEAKYDVGLFRNGEPGKWGKMGEADTLPNYFYLFVPQATDGQEPGNTSNEILLGFTHGGTGTSQGEELMRDFAGRDHEGSQCWVSPQYALADRYQIANGFTGAGTTAPKMDPTSLGTTAASEQAARTKANSAVNPETYRNRDYRQKATMLWDFEKIAGMNSLTMRNPPYVIYVYKTWGVRIPYKIGGMNGQQVLNPDGTDMMATSYNTDGVNSGYVFRKFVRNYAGQGRADGDYNWPVIRYADVLLMYAEADLGATGSVNAPAVAAVNRVRHRGNLPGLNAAQQNGELAFFESIEQERIVELVAEGHRPFDTRRWRRFEMVWGMPQTSGVRITDTQNANVATRYANTSILNIQREYIWKIPQGERDRNPNLTQNLPHF